MGIKNRGQRCLATLACAAAVSIALSACTEGRQPTGESAPSTRISPSNASAPSLDSEIIPHAKAATLQFECDNPIAVGATASDLLEGADKPGVPDVMYISTADTGASPNPWGDGATADGLHFHKMGLIVKAGAAFTLSVPPDMRDRMKIGWSNTGYTVTDELFNPGCTSGQANADWLAYPGGFWLEEPGCIPLNVTKSHTIQTIYIPVGETCP